MEKSIYLDYAAATPMDPRVVEAMEPFFTEMFYNPSASYLAARGARQDLDNIRQGVANTLGAKPAEIIFTAGATEANNLAIQGIMGQHPKAEVLVSAIEHESVLAPANLFNAQKIPVDEQGLIILDKLSNLISDRTALISVMLVNNELGTIQPLREIARLVAEARQKRRARGNKVPLYLHTDAAQAGCYIDLQASRLGVDMMSLNGGKTYGPKQSGLLFVKTGVKLKPLIVGGGQEFGLRSGTENMAAAAGLAKALDIAQSQRPGEARRITRLRQDFEKSLKTLCPRAIINGAKNQRVPHIISVTFPGYDNERLMMELDEAGAQCAVGSACSAGSHEPSHVLKAIGLSEEAAHSTLRFSLGRQTTQEDLEKVAHMLRKLL